MFQTVVEYALSLLSTLREKETLMASLWKYLKFSIKKFYQTMVFRVQFATLVAIRLKHHGNVIVARRWQAPKKMVCLSKQQLKRLRSFPNPIGNCPKTSLLPTMFSSFCSDFNSLTGNTLHCKVRQNRFSNENRYLHIEYKTSQLFPFVGRLMHRNA